MRADVIHPKELDDDLIARWQAFQTSDEALTSPFFSPEFTQCVGAVRSDARVGVIELDGRVAGFFPFHLCGGKIAKPIGGQVCDYQGVVHAPDVSIDGEEMLSACGLAAYDFNHAPIAQSALAAGAYQFSRSPQMALPDGYDAYTTQPSKSLKKALANARRCHRKLEEQVGPIRFAFHEDDDAAYVTHVQLKNASYARMNVKTMLGTGSWLDAVIEKLKQHRSRDFAGVMSALYAGDRLIAAHFGIRSQRVLHWWFNSYDPEFSRFGPGILLILNSAQQSREHGFSLIDFGRGDTFYKRTFANTHTTLCEGSIEAPASVPGLARRTQRLCAKGLKLMPLGRYEDVLRRAGNRVLTGGVRIA